MCLLHGVGLGRARAKGSHTTCGFMCLAHAGVNVAWADHGLRYTSPKPCLAQVCFEDALKMLLGCFQDGSKYGFEMV
jgi:hypothetical protein